MALAGFERIHLNPDETGHVTFKLDPARYRRSTNAGIARQSRPISDLTGGSQPDGDAGQGGRSKEFNIVGTEQIPR